MLPNAIVIEFLFLLFDALSDTTDTMARTKSQETSTMTTTNSGTVTTPMAGSGQNHVGSQIGHDDAPVHKAEETSKSEGTQAGGTLQQHSGHAASTKTTSTGTGTRSKDYNDEMVGATQSACSIHKRHILTETEKSFVRFLFRFFSAFFHRLTKCTITLSIIIHVVKPKAPKT